MQTDQGQQESFRYSMVSTACRCIAWSDMTVSRPGWHVCFEPYNVIFRGSAFCKCIPQVHFASAFCKCILCVLAGVSFQGSVACGCFEGSILAHKAFAGPALPINQCQIHICE
jgi:hypothetical protein